MEQPKAGLSVHIPRCFMQRERLHPPGTEPSAAAGNPRLQESPVPPPELLSDPGQEALGLTGSLQGHSSPFHNLRASRVAEVALVTLVLQLCPAFPPQNHALSCWKASYN